MDVLKRISFVVVFLFLINYVSASPFNVCGVSIEEPWFLVQNSANEDILIVDDDGDIYFRGQDHDLNNKDSYESFVVGNSFFNIVTSNYVDVMEKQSSLPSGSAMIVKSPSGADVAKFADSGIVYTKGMGIFEGSQGACPSDGGYCDGTVYESRDYYCDMTGAKTGSCVFKSLGKEDCATKASTDTDGGKSYLTAGTVRDYISCNTATGCTFNTYTDYCSGDTLREYYGGGTTSFAYEDHFCKDERYCKNGKARLKDIACSSGKCYTKSDTVYDSCIAPSDSVGDYKCQMDLKTRRREIISYSKPCSAGACPTQSSTSYEYLSSCGASEYCCPPYYASQGLCTESITCKPYQYNRWCFRSNDGSVVKFTGGNEASPPVCYHDGNYYTNGEVVSDYVDGGSTGTITCMTRSAPFFDGCDP